MGQQVELVCVRERVAKERGQSFLRHEHTHAIIHCPYGPSDDDMVMRGGQLPGEGMGLGGQATELWSKV